MMKIPTIFPSLCIGILMLSCSGNGEKADGYGNFEATETIISSEANGKLLFFNA